jgi:hypothetical protein
VFEAACENGIETLLCELAFEPAAQRFGVGVGCGGNYSNPVTVLGEDPKESEITPCGPTTRRKIRGVRGEEDSQSVPKYLVSLGAQSEASIPCGGELRPSVWRATAVLSSSRSVGIADPAIRKHKPA